MTITTVRLSTVALLVLLAPLSSCGRKVDDTKAMGQAIAHVGPDDITQPELDNEFRNLNIPANKRDDAATKAVLSELVLRKQLVQQALAAKLDREPTTHLQLLRAREQTLANAIMQRNVGTKVSAIGKGDIDKYVEAHPDQFAKRVTYASQQLTFSDGKDMDAIVAGTKDLADIDAVAAKLTSLGVKFNRSEGSIDGATLPEPVLKAIKARKDTDVFFLRNQNGGVFFKVKSEIAAPLSADESSARARQALSAELARSESSQAMTTALGGAKFEGDYARIMASTPAPTPAPTDGGAAPSAAPSPSPTLSPN